MNCASCKDKECYNSKDYTNIKDMQYKEGLE